MNAFIQYAADELPKVEQCLHDRIEALSPYVRPTARHVIDAGGKRLRPLLTILTAKALGYAGDGIYPLACSLELLHAATLLHDDILDRAELRRGRPSAHILFGSTHTILAGDALLALANTMVAQYGLPELTACLSQAILSTVTGEIQEIARIRDVALTTDEYMEIITGKTACLIQAACQSGAILAAAATRHVRAASAFGLNLGVAFQLVDDALDYTSSKEVSGKPGGGDLREGKLTLPLILLLEKMPPAEKEAFTNSFKENTLSDTAIGNILGDVTNGGHAARTRELAAGFLEDARKSLGEFPASTEASLLAAALEGMAQRDK